MGQASSDTGHSAEAVALGFYYQTFFALLTLLRQNTDDASVALEQLDDVDLKTDGQTLLFQLKHSLRLAPAPVTVASRTLWRTLKVWIDLLPRISLSETTFHLVTVASVPTDSPLAVLIAQGGHRTELVQALEDEAARVVEARSAAAKRGTDPPHSDRIDACQAFLALDKATRQNLLRRVALLPHSPKIDEIEDQIVEHLKILPHGQRPAVASRLVEWWDRQVIYSLCEKRDRVISRTELQARISIVVGEIEQGRLVADFETVSHPEDYQPDGMLARQVQLVGGRRSDLAKAIREEWRAREQRSKWINEKPNMATMLGDYDQVLCEHWSDLHQRAAEDCEGVVETEKAAAGLKILRWTHDQAPNVVRPVATGWTAPYYVRGSYQVLAIALKVGWHPEYTTLLGDDE